MSSADQLRTLQELGDSDTDWAGLGDYSPCHTPMPAEACTELGSEPAAPRGTPHALRDPIARHPRLALAIALLLLVLLTAVGTPEDTPDVFEAHADALAAAEVQP